MANDTASSPIHESVHDVRVKQSARVTLQGQMVPTTGVTYYVGQHGPFTDQYDTATYNTDEAQQGILQRVHQVQSVDSGVPGPSVVKHEPGSPMHPFGPNPPKTMPPFYSVTGKPMPQPPLHMRPTTSLR